MTTDSTEGLPWVTAGLDQTPEAQTSTPSEPVAPAVPTPAVDPVTPAPAADKPIEPPAPEPTAPTPAADAAVPAEPVPTPPVPAEPATVTLPDARPADPAPTLLMSQTAINQALGGPPAPSPDVAGPDATAALPPVATPPPRPPHATPLAAAAPAPEPKGHPVVTAALSLVGVVALFAGVVGVGALYFQSHANPGAAIAGHDVSGFNQTQVRDVATALAGQYQVTLNLGAKSVTAKPADIGLAFDLDRTVSQAMQAGDTQTVAERYNPFESKSVPLDMTVDQAKLATYLDQTFITPEQRPVSADVKYDADKKEYVVLPSVTGTQTDPAAVAAALAQGGGSASPLTVATMSELPPISDEAAQAVADAANAQLKTKYVISAGEEQYIIPAASIAAWTVLTPDPAKGTINRTIDEAKVKADLPAMMAKNLTTAMVPQKILISSDGTELGVEQDGKDGTKVADPAAVANSLILALTAGKAATIKANVVTDPYTTNRVGMDPKYTVPNGERWVEVDLSSYSVTRWEGSTKLSTWLAVIGRPATPTWTGVYHVWLKVDLQDMTGSNADGSKYLSEDVPWTAYFNGDIGIHGNYWVWPMGQAASHGCVGLPVDQAKIMYDWIEVGDLVIVHQ